MSNYTLAHFTKLLTYPMMESKESRTILSMMFTNCAFGENGVTASKSIPADSLTYISFVHPLMAYDSMYKLAMKDFVKNIPKSKNLSDFSERINSPTRNLIYANLSAAADFFQFPIDMIPGVNRDALSRGMDELRRTSESAIMDFTPDNLVKSSNLFTYKSPNRNIFTGDNAMLWFLSVSDIEWTIDLFNAGSDASRLNTRTLPYDVALRMVAPPTQVFFDLYSSGVEAMALNKPLTTAQYSILFMIFYLDSMCYHDWTTYHTRAGLYDSSMVIQANNIVDNTKLMFNKIKSLMETQGMSTTSLPNRVHMPIELYNY